MSVTSHFIQGTFGEYMPCKIQSWYNIQTKFAYFLMMITEKGKKKKRKEQAKYIEKYNQNEK